MANVEPMRRGAKYDFYMDCKYYDDQKGEWDFSCMYKARSGRAKQEFGNKDLGYIAINRDPLIIDLLVQKYGIPQSTAILSFVTRYRDADRGNKLKGIGMAMLCSLLKYLRYFHNVTHVFLVATTRPSRLESLINLYRRYGFRSVDQSDPKNMIASVNDIRKGCLWERKGQTVPTLFVPETGSPIQQRRFVKDTSLGSS